MIYDFVKIIRNTCKRIISVLNIFILPEYMDFIRRQHPVRVRQWIFTLVQEQRQVRRIKYLLSYAIVYLGRMNELQLWLQDANHIQHLMITSPIRGYRQALTATGTRKRTNTIPWIIPILTLTIIRRKNPRCPRGTTPIPNRRSGCWMWIMAPMRIARDRQRS
jgi:hypothetical protein